MIAETLASIRVRLRDVIVRRQRGIRVAESDLDSLLDQVGEILEAIDKGLLGEISPISRKRETIEEKINALEDATCDAQTAASDLRSALLGLRDRLNGIDKPGRAA